MKDTLMPIRKMPEKPIEKVQGSEILKIYMQAAMNNDISVGHTADNNPVTRAINISEGGYPIPQFRKVVRNKNLLQSEGFSDDEIEIVQAFGEIIAQEGQGRISTSSIRILHARLLTQINSDYFFHNNVREHSEIEDEQIDWIISDDDDSGDDSEDDSEDNSEYDSEDDSDSEDISDSRDGNEENLSILN